MSFTLTLISVFFLCLLIWSIIDFRKWKKLGKGGVPYNIFGWLIVTAIRPFKRNPFSSKYFEGDIGSNCDKADIDSLPHRNGERPVIAKHPVPHRQLNQIRNDTIKESLQKTFDQMVESHNKDLNYDLSQFEKRNKAIWLRNPESGNSCPCANGEIAHIHQIDGSMHMILSPSDAKKVIDSGWGELHPLAGKFIPVKTYVLIYSPRDKEDLKVIESILAASVVHAR